ncbi:MAG: serpin family protein [Gemmataceae bacterium]|nr:serpin family protein [Gemmataceae bacterium]
MVRTLVALLFAGLFTAGVAVAGKPDISRGNNTFALDLFAKLRAREGNLFVSPFSISAALAMTEAGARGDTLAEMAKVLHLPGDATTHDEFGKLIADLQTPNAKSGYQLRIANAVWGGKGLVFRPEYIDLTQKHYGGGLKQVNFGNPPEAMKTINSWVEDQTNNKIKDLLRPGNIDANTEFVITNAVYFKDSWTHAFQKGATQDAPFFAATGEVKAPLMRVNKSFPYFAGDGLQAVELPYRGGRLGMVVLLPQARDGLAALEASLTQEKLEGWLKAMATKDGTVWLPKFKIEDRMNVENTLKEMGMRKAFTGEADFGGMTSGSRLMIDQVIHQTYIAVDEEGTEAAAATAVTGVRGAAPVRREPFEFRADHPFLFVIRDRQTGAILFLGRVAKV